MHKQWSSGSSVTRISRIASPDRLATPMDDLRAYLLRELSGVFADEREVRQVVRALIEDAPRTALVELDTRIPVWFEQAVTRLKAGEPVQYVTGKAHFHGLVLEVGPAVLIPRPETEEMTDLAWKRARHMAHPRILDIGTGSGCIAIVLAVKMKNAYIEAWDISGSALEVAARNADRHGVEVRLLQRDALDQRSWSREHSLDLIISNPPYISAQESVFMDSSVRNHEPVQALYGPADDPLAFYRTIAREGRNVLRQGGMTICECSEFSSGQVAEIFVDAGWHDVELLPDMQGKERFLVALS